MATKDIDVKGLKEYVKQEYDKIKQGEIYSTKQILEEIMKRIGVSISNENDKNNRTF